MSVKYGMVGGVFRYGIEFGRFVRDYPRAGRRPGHIHLCGPGEEPHGISDGTHMHTPAGASGVGPGGYGNVAGLEATTTLLVDSQVQEGDKLTVGANGWGTLAEPGARAYAVCLAGGEAYTLVPVVFRAGLTG